MAILLQSGSFILLQDGTSKLLLQNDTAGGPSTNANAGVATGTGSALSPSEAVGQIAGSSASTGSALQGSETLLVNAGVATATGASHGNAPYYVKYEIGVTAIGILSIAGEGAGASTNANAGVATATGSSYQSGQSIGVSVGVATATGLANSPTEEVDQSVATATSTGLVQTQSEKVDQPTGLSTGTGAARAPTASSAQLVGVATATAAALNPLESVQQPAGSASGTGTAQGPRPNISQLAGLATGTGSSNSPSESVAQPVSLASATGTAHNPTASTASSTNADAGVATSTGSALNPSVLISQSASTATAISSAFNVTASIRASAGLATANGSALDTSELVSVKPPQATATGSAINPSEFVSQTTGSSSGSGSALNPSETIQAKPTLATGTGSALNLIANVSVKPSTATGTGEAFNATANTVASTNANAGLASATGTAFSLDAETVGQSTTNANGSGSALNPRQSVLQPAGVATASGVANNPTASVRVNPVPAYGSGFINNWNGTNYISLPGGSNASNTISIPAAIGSDIDLLGDLTIAIKYDRFNPTQDRAYIQRRQAGVDSNLIPFNFGQNTSGTGTLKYMWANAAGVTTTIFGTVSTPANTQWVGVTHQLDNGSSQNVVRFYYSTDGSSWNLLETFTNPGTTTRRSNAANVYIPASNTSVWGAVGRFYQAKVWSGLAFSGTPVIDINTATDVSDPNAVTFTATSGQTVTVTRSTSGAQLEIIVPTSITTGSKPFVNQPAGIATSTGSAFNASVSVTPSSGLATGVGQASGAVANVQPNAGSASGTGSVNQIQELVNQPATIATGTGAAYNPVAQTSGSTSAFPAVATATGTANKPAIGITDGTGSGTGSAGGLALGAGAKLGSGSGSANGSSQSILQSAVIATGTGLANNPRQSISQRPGISVGTGTALNPSVSIAQSVGVGSGTGTGQSGSESAAQSAQLANANGSIKSLKFSGLAFSNAYAPDIPAYAISGDVEVVLRVSFDTWNPPLGLSQVPLSHGYGTGFYVYVQATTIGMGITLSGGNVFPNVAWAGGSRPSPGQVAWLRFRRATATGTATFEWAPDQTTEPTSWTNIGSDTRTSGNILTPAQPMYIGSGGNGTASAGNERSRSQILRAIVRNGFDGTAVFDVDAINLTPGASSFVENSSNAATVTLGTAARIGTLTDPVASVSQSIGSAAGSGSAFNVAAGIGTTTAAGSGSGQNQALGVGAIAAVGVSTAYNPTAQTSGNTSAFAGVATASGAAYNPTANTVSNTSAPAGVATATGTSFNSRANIAASAGQASGTGSSNLTSEIVAPNAGSAIASASVLARAELWLDAGTSSLSGGKLKNLGSSGSGLDAIVGLTTSSGEASDPALLTWQGENYVYFPGVASTGNAVTVTQNAALDALTGDIEMVARVHMDMTGLSISPNIISKFNAAVRLFVGNSTGIMRFWVNDGTTTTEVTSGSALPTQYWDGTTAVWLKVTRRISDGLTQFFYAPDSTSEPSGVGWTQLGTDKTNTRLINATSLPWNFGTYATAGHEPMKGRFYRGIVRDAPNGNTVLDVDFTTGLKTGGETTLTASTGQLVTINRATSGLKTVAVTKPVWLFGTEDYLQVDSDPLGAYVALPGIDGSNVRTADDPSLDIAGDIELVARVQPNAMLSSRGIINKNVSYRVITGNSDPSMLWFGFWDNTATLFSAFSSSGVLALNTTRWIKVTRAQSTGLVSFFWAADQPTEPTAWTAAGTATLSAGAGIGPSGNHLEVGTRDLNIAPMEGKIYRAIVRNGIAGPTVADFNAANFSAGATTATDSLGRPWTINGSASLVNANPLNMGANQNFSVILIARTWDTSTTFKSYIGKRAVTSAGIPGGYELDFSNVNQQMRASVATTTGIFDAPQTNRWSPAGETVVASFIRDASGIRIVRNTTATANTSTTGYYGDTSSVAPFRVGARYSTPSEFGDLEVFGVLAFKRALTLNEIAEIGTYYGIVPTSDIVAPNAGSGSGNGIAHGPGQNSASGVGRAIATGSAFNPSVSIKPNSGIATANGSAFGVSAKVSQSAGTSTGAGSSPSTNQTIAQSANAAVSTATAINPSFSVGVSALAGTANAVGQARSAIANQFTDAKPNESSATGEAHNPTYDTYITWTDASEAIKPVILTDVTILTDVNGTLAQNDGLSNAHLAGTGSNDFGEQNKSLSDNNLPSGKNITLGSFKKLD